MRAKACVASYYKTRHMRSFGLILILLLTTGFTNIQQPEQWYKVTASDNKMWSAGMNICIMPLGGDSVYISGFSNHGAGATGTIGKGRIEVPKQTRTIIPHGGYGKIQWDITVSATGYVTDSAIIMLFYFAKDSFETIGHITAVKYVAAGAGTSTPKDDK